MPLRVRAPLRSALSKPSESYICRDCLLKTRNLSPFPRYARSTSTSTASTPYGRPTGHLARAPRPSKTFSASLTRRYSNGSLASTSAINAPTSVPYEYRELHQRLLALQEKAGSFVDLSRIHLAARSLESHEPVIRVALLGLGDNGALAARKLARVLLSDPLAEEEDWERSLLASGKDGRSLLLRYGAVEDAVQSSALVQTMHVPSPFLQRSRVEILVTTWNSSGSEMGGVDSSEVEEALLVPSLTTPTSAGGRVGFVRFPVHKAVVVAEGISGAVEYGRLSCFLPSNPLITSALSLPLRSSTSAQSTEEQVTGNAVDTDLASDALSLFRKDNANGAEFSRRWQTSQLPVVSQWIAGESGADHTETIKGLIQSIITNGTNTASKVRAREQAIITARTITPADADAVANSISTWSSDAHRDLQTNLNAAIASPTWRRTSWWRLLWRIDDVSASAADILRRSWLVEAEQSLAFLSGRMTGVLAASEDQLRQTGISPLVDQANKDHMTEFKSGAQETRAELMQIPSMLAEVKKQTGIDPLFDPPWPQTINLSRQYMIHKVVPDLHAKAQALLLAALSTVAGSAGVGAWFYVATSGLGLYEAGAVAALGTVWSLRRLQKKWGKERDAFATSLFNDGCGVLEDVEARLRDVLRRSEKCVQSQMDNEGDKVAIKAIEKCREALGR